MSSSPGSIVEVFADIVCPFTHVGLRRFVERRAEAGRDDVKLHIRAWPLEVVNGSPLDAHFFAEEIEDVRVQVAPDLFTGFQESAFPASSVPALALAAAAYQNGLEVGEQVSLELRDLLFEQGRDISEPDVLAEVADRFGVATDPDLSLVVADHAAGLRRGVIGSPHFFTPSEGFFCPALEISRDGEGHLRIVQDPVGFNRFVDSCFSSSPSTDQGA